MKHSHLVILSGGSEYCFWPLCDEHCPKQFHDILGSGRTMLQMTYDHFQELVPRENIWVVTPEPYASLVREQLPEVRVDRIIQEPEEKGTAASVAYISWRIKSIDPRANVVVTPCDHLISDLTAFRETITRGMSFTAETDSVLLIGVPPKSPETSYGYMEADMSYASTRHKGVFRIDHFKEKPSQEEAGGYQRINNIFWNSGICIWNVSTIVNACRVYQPEMSRLFEALLSYYGTDEEKRKVVEAYRQCEAISLDYAIMEKVEDLFMCVANFGWRDLSSWRAFAEEMEKDLHGNTCLGNVKTFDTNNCIIHTAGYRDVIVQGLDGYIIVERNGVLLICKREEEQRINTFRKELK